MFIFLLKHTHIHTCTCIYKETGLCLESVHEQTGRQPSVSKPSQSPCSEEKKPYLAPTYQNNRKIYFTSKNNFKSGSQALLSTTFNNPLLQPSQLAFSSRLCPASSLPVCPPPHLFLWAILMRNQFGDVALSLFLSSLSLYCIIKYLYHIPVSVTMKS